MLRNLSVLLIIVWFAGCNSQSNVYHSGFMYWYGPTPLQADWHGLLIGTVSSVNKKTDEKNDEVYSGQINIKEVLFPKPIKGSKSLSVNKSQKRIMWFGRDMTRRELTIG
jgi:hypothetical protein